ncbi:MAG TPA: ethanolamine permease [Bdellovibrionota bacterium]|nr:ethanolamine permease [Bdellovibrionota bacterium]
MSEHLSRSLGPVMLWGLGVGYVISGEYFGWNLGLPDGGPIGLLIATLLVSVMYIAFSYSYAELACAIPRAGGAFVYTSRALGPTWGFLGGAAQILEFVFAPPAIAAAIGGYFVTYFPGQDPKVFAIIAYILFTALNIYGVKHSAIFELGITILAVVELLIFAGVTAPHFHLANLTQDAMPNGIAGIFTALPFAIWFYLGIEGVANVAEEAKNPQKDITRGFGSAIFTLVALALITLVCAVGVDGWKSVVFKLGSTAPSDTPLPMAMAKVVGDSHALFHILVTIGLFGLIASFNGLVLVSGRAIMEFGRVGYAPHWTGTILKKRHTPAAALLINLVLGIIALLSGRTGDIITLSVFGAITLYALSMVAFFVLRKKEPKLARPFKTPGHPWVPGSALVLSVLCLVAMVYYNRGLFLIYLGLLALGYVWYLFFVPAERKKARI